VIREETRKPKTPGRRESSTRVQERVFKDCKTLEEQRNWHHLKRKHPYPPYYRADTVPNEKIESLWGKISISIDEMILALSTKKKASLRVVMCKCTIQTRSKPGCYTLKRLEVRAKQRIWRSNLPSQFGSLAATNVWNLQAAGIIHRILWPAKRHMRGVKCMLRSMQNCISNVHFAVSLT
jgi:hypothetical protein